MVRYQNEKHKDFLTEALHLDSQKLVLKEVIKEEHNENHLNNKKRDVGSRVFL